MKKTIITIIFAVFLISSGIVLGVFLTKRNSYPTALVLFSINKNQNNNIVKQNNLKIEETNLTNNNLNSNIEILLFVNVQGKVLSVSCLNNLSKDLYQNISYDGRLLNEAVNEITSTAIKEGFFENRDNIINFGVYTNNIKQSQNIKNCATKKLNKLFDDSDINVNIKFNINLQTTNLGQKYAFIAYAMQIDIADFKDKTESEVLQYINFKSIKFKGNM